MRDDSTGSSDKGVTEPLVQHELSKSPRRVTSTLQKVIGMYILRPRSILTTPRLFRDYFRTLGYKPKLRRIETVRDGIIVPPRDLLLSLPHPMKLFPRYRTPDYLEAYHFCRLNKLQQREYLTEYFPVPETVTEGELQGRYILRPLRHTQGRDYTVQTDGTVPQGYYASKVFPKKHEYRILYLKGRTVTLIKKFHGDTPSPELPWNHTHGSFFVTVHNEENNRLRHTDIYQRIESFPLKDIQFFGLDVLLKFENDSYEYVISEMNMTPAVTIPNNLEALCCI